MRTLATPDLQAQRPHVAVALSRAGVTDVQRLVRLGDDVLDATFTCAVDLGSDQRGAHMSRFEEAVDEALDAARGLDDLALPLARLVRERQDAARAHVTVEARRAEDRLAPASGLPTAEIHTVLAAASASGAAARRSLGVRVQGITACPCAQETLSARATERLRDRGFTAEQIEAVVDDVPVATHNQRGLATLTLGASDAVPAGTLATAPLLAIARDAMSAEVFELLKRSDEADVVERAHRRPRFVEDCVREMLAGVVDELGHLGDDVLVDAHQRNLETIHRHDVVARRTALLGDLRSELAGAASPPPRPSLDAWLSL